MEMSVVEITKFLNTYSGRDKVLRTLCYGSRFIAGLVPSESTAKKLDSFSEKISACRTILRLLDDIPMLSCTLSYGLGKQDKDTFLRIVGVLTNAVDQVYYPIEHVAWAADHQLVSVDGGPWWTASTICWVFSLYLGVLRSVRCITILQHHKSCLDSVDCDIGIVLARLRVKQSEELLTLARCVLDLVHAIHCLPQGYLWANWLSRCQVGAIGTVSSLLGLYQAVWGRSS